MKRFLLALGLLLGLEAPAFAASATIYFDTGGCQSGSTTRCSGTTDSASATVSAAAATVTCSATDGPASTPGCVFSGTPSLAGIATDGSQALFVNCATNTNQKIFFINGIDDSTDRVGTTVTPTGCTAASSDWGIGGRMIYTSANWEAGIRAGDTVVFNNTPASKTTDFITMRVNGTAAAPIHVKGKTGVRPVLNVTNTTQLIDGATNDYWWYENLELDQDGASGACVQSVGNRTRFTNIKIVDCGGIGLDINSEGDVLFEFGEITGAGAEGIRSGSATRFTVTYSYIHDNATNGITASDTAGVTVIGSIIDTNTGRGILASGAGTAGGTRLDLINSVIALNGDSGLEVSTTAIFTFMTNNIFYNNGNAVGEFNFENTVAAAELAGAHQYNDFFCGGSCNANLSNLTTNSTEITTDPAFTDAANGDFSIGVTSPALGTGFPGTLLGGTNVGYMDMGALQLQYPSTSHILINPGTGGGLH